MKRTKLILLRDVPKLGLSGEVVTVAGGYARNYLVPRRFAQLWTVGGQRQIDSLERARRRREISNVEDARSARDSLLEAGVVSVSKRAGESGRLFGAVSAQEIAQAIYQQIQVKVDHRNLQLEQPLKTVGEYQVTVKLHSEVQAEIKVVVKAEE